MQILTVTGFLGSGKTTLMLQAMEYLAKKEKTFAVIVNEAGAVGIDNAFFKKASDSVWEVLGGCICCTSVSGFQTALEEIRDMRNPDWVLIEPSGIADPEQVMASLNKEGAARTKTVALLDSDRIDDILDAVYPLARSTIAVSDMVLVTKTDIAKKEGVQKAEAFAGEAKPGVPVFPVNLTAPLDAEFMKRLLSC